MAQLDMLRVAKFTKLLSNIATTNLQVFSVLPVLMEGLVSGQEDKLFD